MGIVFLKISLAHSSDQTEKQIAQGKKEKKEQELIQRFSTPPTTFVLSVVLSDL